VNDVIGTMHLSSCKHVPPITALSAALHCRYITLAVVNKQSTHNDGLLFQKQATHPQTSASAQVARYGPARAMLRVLGGDDFCEVDQAALLCGWLLPRLSSDDGSPRQRVPYVGLSEFWSGRLVHALNEALCCRERLSLM
jgi:hypothetical protein